MILNNVNTILILFVSGYLFINYFYAGERSFRKIIIALPFGVCLWSLFWILSASVLNIFHVNNNFSTTLCAASLLISADIFYILKNRYILKEKQNSVPFLLGLIMLVLLIIFFEKMNMSLIFGDSFSFLTWSYDTIGLLGKGYPLVGLSVANLSNFIAADHYLFVLYPLINLCLVLLIFDHLSSFKNTENFIFSLCISFALAGLFVLNNNFIWHTIYVNYHALFSVILLYLTGLFVSRSPVSSKKITVFILFILSMLTVLRMEGMLISISALIFIFYKIGVPKKIRKFATAVYFIFSFAYILLLSASLWHNQYFSSKRYIFLWVCFGFFIYFAEKHLIKNPDILKNTSELMAFLSVVLLTVLFVFRYDHMSESAANLLSNIFNTEYWGISNFIFLIFMAGLIIYRYKKTLGRKTYDDYFYFFIFLLFLTVALSNFRPPFRPGWSDTGNRMFYHFIPLLVVWTGRSLIDLITTEKK